MNVAVLSLTRERLSAVKVSLPSLAANAGCEYDHLILDQGSRDGLLDWLPNYGVTGRTLKVPYGKNIGIAAGLNHLLDITAAFTYEPRPDVIVKFDPDVIVNRPGTLAAVAHCALRGNMVCSPRVQGLNNPPTPTGHTTFVPHYHRMYEVTEMGMVGGCFLAAPASLYENWRYPEELPKWGGDDDAVCARARALGMSVGYLEGYDVTHDTKRHHAEHPDYFARTLAEGKPAL